MKSIPAFQFKEIKKIMMLPLNLNSRTLSSPLELELLKSKRSSHLTLQFIPPYLIPLLTRSTINTRQTVIDATAAGYHWVIPKIPKDENTLFVPAGVARLVASGLVVPYILVTWRPSSKNDSSVLSVETPARLERMLDEGPRTTSLSFRGVGTSFWIRSRSWRVGNLAGIDWKRVA